MTQEDIKELILKKKRETIEPQLDSIKTVLQTVQALNPNYENQFNNYNMLLDILNILNPEQRGERELKMSQFRLNPNYAQYEVLSSIKEYFKYFFSPENQLKLKGENGYTPQVGIDYFTDEDIETFKLAAKPIKGIDYVDGKKGDKGEKGENGKDAKIDTEKLKQDLLMMLENNQKNILENLLTKEDVLKLLEEYNNIKIPVEKIDGIENYILRAIPGLRKATTNFGGHGGTTKQATLTTADSTTFTLSPNLATAELQVYRGGIRIFSENGDFTATTVAGNKTSAITLAFALNTGETLNILGK